MTVLFCEYWDCSRIVAIDNQPFNSENFSLYLVRYFFRDWWSGYLWGTEGWGLVSVYMTRTATVWMSGSWFGSAPKPNCLGDNPPLRKFHKNSSTTSWDIGKISILVPILQWQKNPFKILNFKIPGSARDPDHHKRT